MTVQGHIEDGQVVLEDPLDVPNGTKVAVLIESGEPKTSGIEGADTNSAQGHVRRPTLSERFKDIIGAIDDLPEDMAENHDHYLHGTPKR